LGKKGRFETASLERAMRPKLFIHLIILASLSLLVVSICRPGPNKKPYPGGQLSTPSAYYKVKYVYDGDTVLLDSAEKLRYLGINAPEIDHKGEKSEFLAFAARDLNLDLVNGARVRLEYGETKRDRYGRLLAYVFLENGNMANAIMVRKGLAHVLLTNQSLKYKGVLLDCQRKAIKEGLGIWSRHLKGKEKNYLGNRRSYRFHRPSCPFGRRIKSSNLVRFKSRRDAFWEGFSPCKHCKP